MRTKLPRVATAAIASLALLSTGCQVGGERDIAAACEDVANLDWLDATRKVADIRDGESDLAEDASQIGELMDLLLVIPDGDEEWPFMHGHMRRRAESVVLNAWAVCKDYRDMPSMDSALALVRDGHPERGNSWAEYEDDARPCLASDPDFAAVVVVEPGPGGGRVLPEDVTCVDWPITE